MNKRELVMQVLEENKPQAYIPAGFFIHFDPKYHHGQAAIDKHLEYFHYTGMDFVKIQYEKVFPFRKEILKPEDWVNMPKYGIEFYQEQVEVARGLVKAAGKDALVIMTLYSPFMCARDTVGGVVLVKQIRENPEAVKIGMEIITESLRIFVRACIEAGVDGFYHSTQGGETNRFEGSPLFDECIKPFDLSLMNEINEKCHFNILHICDYIASYNDLTPFLEYPGHVVNSSLTLGKRTITAQQVVDLFQRPFMGGVERLGTIANGTPAEIETMIRQVMKNAPHRYILGADCTLPSTVNWDSIRLAISLAHQHQPS